MSTVEAPTRLLLPPLLSGVAVMPPADPFDAALQGVAAGELGAGDLLYGTDTGQVRLALVLEPEVPRARCDEMLALVMDACADAAGAVIPAEIGISFTWPGGIRLNGGLVGHARLRIGDGIPPDWMVVALDLQLAALPGHDPGNRPDRTSFADEGCAIDPTALIESMARHLVHWLHRWEEDGFAPVHRHWMDRLDTRAPLARGIAGRLIGMDAHGNAVLDGPNPGMTLCEALR